MKRLISIINLFFFYLKEVVLSNLRVAHDVVTPRHRMKPGIVRLNVEDLTDRQLFFMANLITMTPGTLGLAVSEDRKEFYIHAMYIDRTTEELVQSLERDYGRRVKSVF
ncbi:MAG: Na+/H+ antiporter subunit E [Verrucomicrobiota bacterium]